MLKLRQTALSGVPSQSTFHEEPRVGGSENGREVCEHLLDTGIVPALLLAALYGRYQKGLAPRCHGHFHFQSKEVFYPCSQYTIRMSLDLYFSALGLSSKARHPISLRGRLKVWRYSATR